MHLIKLTLATSIMLRKQIIIPQHYGIGFKEVWDLDPQLHEEGLVVHTMGWPAAKGVLSGSYLYHGENNQAFLGYIVP